ncbi:MAG TPA: recombinase family protein, partial [Clostridiales bacterium]|nr:recombinase family protein [Clostridiales bacterium]
VSGINENRPGLNEMLEKAYNGEVDLIITKSISRFSRNIVFLLKTLRKLREAGVDVYFEKENITSFSMK